MPCDFTKETLKNYIQDIKNLIVENSSSYQFITNDSSSDNQVFPLFSDTYEFIYSKSDVLIFLKNINQILKEFYNTLVNFKTEITKNIKTNLIEYLDENDAKLEYLFSKIGKNIIIKDLNKGRKKVNCENKITLIENTEFKSKSIEALNLLKELSDKLETYIKRFDAYNDGYIFDIEDIDYAKKATSDDFSKISFLIETKTEIQKILTKKYELDLFDDGKESIREMVLPILKTLKFLSDNFRPQTNFYYEINDTKIDDIPAFFKNYISSYYSCLDHILEKEDFINDETIELANKNLSNNLEIDLFNRTPEGSSESEIKLNKLIGLKDVKESISKIKAYLKKNGQKNALNLNMAFEGNPGTGKTIVARLMADILYENKILPTNNIVEVSRKDLVGRYIGHTAFQTEQICESALGGVLFIDEAYSLFTEDGIDFGHEAIATLIKFMEDNAGKFCLIIAGYENELEEMIASNPGFNSRILFKLKFSNYNREELGQILDLMVQNKSYKIDLDAKKLILDILDEKRKDVNFANAREVRNVLDQVILNQNLRCENTESDCLSINDVKKFISENKINLKFSKNIITKTGFDELNDLIGLSSVKNIIKKIFAYAKKNKENQNINLHMIFKGNPGTGKTIVGRIVSKIFYEAGVLEESKFIETNANGLISKYVGQTGTKTEALVKKAMGGVLFIDEAYSLIGSGNSVYGEEAISTLIKLMEDYRGKFCVILAGYDEEMNRLIASNQGFESRIQFTINFNDYNSSEIKELAVKMLEDFKYNVSDDALEEIIKVVEFYRDKENFANARTLRNVLEQVIMNQNLRTLEIESNLIILDDVLTYEIENHSFEKNVSSANVDALKHKNKLINELSNTNVNKLIDFNYIKSTIISIYGKNTQSTGFLITKSGFALTCAHCICTKDKQKVRVNYSSNGNLVFDFNLIDIDEKNDIALIKILSDDETCFNFLELCLDENFNYEPLSKFLMAGYPFGGETFKEVSITEGSIISVNNINDREVVFTDVLGKPGSSGSPIIDETSKKVIGIFWGTIGNNGENIKCLTPFKFVYSLIFNNQF